MSTAELGGLAVLALIDSTSFGTLLIPLWFMLAPRLRAGRLLLYLAVVAGFYLAFGLLLLAGLDVAVDALGGLERTRGLLVAQLAVGVGLVLLSYVVDPAYDGIGRKRPEAERGPSARALGWQSRLTRADVSLRAVVVIALTATVLEVATMLPYLAAIGLIASSDEPDATQVLLVAAYVVVMVLPALLLLGIRVAAHRLVEPLLERVSDWMTRRAGSAVAWVIGIVGVLVALDAANRLF